MQFRGCNGYLVPSQCRKSPLIQAIGKGFQRALAKPKIRKEPITPEMLRRLVASMASPLTLSETRLAAICLLAFAAFLHFDEISKLRCCDIKFTEECMEVSITSSKTDQYRQGQLVPIARTGTATCPVAMVQKYMRLAQIQTSSKEHLFRGLCSTKKGQKLRAGGSLSYSRMREIVKTKLRELGYNEKKFGLHSFRAGGATAAANNPCVAERLFKRHGRWSSETAKDGYVKDSLQSRLKVSQGLGL